MIIPYTLFRDGSKLPFVRFKILGPRRDPTVDAFVDSGADFSIFHAGWMKYLGLSVKGAVVRKIQVGDGDYIQAYELPVTVEFYGRSFRAPLTFSARLGPGFNLLGRKGFFERFRFCFDDKHFRLSVTRI